MAIAQQGKKEKFLLHKRESIGIVILLLPLFIFTTMALMWASSDYMIRCLFTPTGLLTVLVLDFVWFIIIKLYHFKSALSKKTTVNPPHIRRINLAL